MSTTAEDPPGRHAPHQPTRAQLREVRGMVEETSRQMAVLPRGTLLKLAPILARAQRETQDALRSWLENAPNGSDRYTAHVHRETLLHLNAAMKAIRDLEPELAGALIDGGDQMGRLALSRLEREVARMSAVFDGTVRALPLQKAAIIAEGNTYLIPRFETSAARYAGRVQADIQTEFAVGIAKRETVHQLVDRLVRYGGPRGFVALQGIDGNEDAIVEFIGEGLFRRYRYWAERVARTELAAAGNHQLDLGIRDLHAMEPGIMRRWDASMDRRVCLDCAALHNSTATVGGVFPGGFDTAPAHPNCRCRVGAWMERWNKYLDWMREAQARDPG